jgi:hypothetical protein
MHRIIRRTVCTAESTAESRSAISQTLHNDKEKRNSCQSKNRRRRPETTPASVLCAPCSVSYPSTTAKAVCW